MPLPVNVEAFERFVERQRNQDRRPSLDQLVKPDTEPLVQYTIIADAMKCWGWRNEKGDDRLGGVVGTPMYGLRSIRFLLNVEVDQHSCRSCYSIWVEAARKAEVKWEAGAPASKKAERFTSASSTKAAGAAVEQGSRHADCFSNSILVHPLVASIFALSKSVQKIRNRAQSVSLPRSIINLMEAQNDDEK